MRSRSKPCRGHRREAPLLGNEHLLLSNHRPVAAKLQNKPAVRLSHIPATSCLKPIYAPDGLFLSHCLLKLHPVSKRHVSSLFSTQLSPNLTSIPPIDPIRTDQRVRVAPSIPRLYIIANETMLASPTPAPAGPIRRASQRQALRRPTSRSMLSRAESQQAYASGGAGPGPAADIMADQSKQYRDDSSEDEIPVPMKLSALTKALLNDPEDAAARGPSPPRTRRQASILNSSTNSAQAAKERRLLRSRSVQRQESSRVEREPSPGKSRDHSPVRKRVVRLSRDSQGLNQMGPIPAKRRSTSVSRGARKESLQPPSRPSSRAESHGDEKADPQRDMNTPSQAPLRVVRINSSSSVKRRIAARRSSGLNPDVSAADGSALDLAQDHQTRRDDIDSGVRTGSSASKSSGSRYPSSSLRNRPDENANLHSSMRIKRVGKTPGGFLSGPARRGKRRQSEEEGGEELGEGDQLFHSQERGMQPGEDGGALSYVRDFNSGSPLSSHAAARASHRRQASQVDLQLGSKQPSPRGIDLSRKEDPLALFEAGLPSPKGIAMPAPKQERNDMEAHRPVRPDLPSNHDQENEVPGSWRRSKPSVDLIMEKIPSRPLHADIPSVKAVNSPERKPLAAITKNTPSQALPPPPPKMSVLETATSNAGAAATTQAKQRRNVLRVNGKVYTRLDCIGRGGSAKVYRVTAENGHMFALKRVSLENTDETVLRGFRGEIELLTKLNGVERVINLFDHELNSEKKVLYLVSHADP